MKPGYNQAWFFIGENTRDPATSRIFTHPSLADTPQGTELSFWLATDDGPLQVTLPPQESVAFIPEASGRRLNGCCRGRACFAPLALKDFHRQPIVGPYCRAHRQLMRLEKMLRDSGVTVYEGDIRPPERYLMERFITAPVWVEGETRARSWSTHA